MAKAHGKPLCLGPPSFLIPRPSRKALGVSGLGLEDRALVKAPPAPIGSPVAEILYYDEAGYEDAICMYICVCLQDIYIYI